MKQPPRDGAANEARVTQTSGADSRQIGLTANSLNARDLFASSREISIIHGDETYRLRLTAQNKLILTK